MLFLLSAELITFIEGNKGSIYPQLVVRNHVYYRYRGASPLQHYWKCCLYDRGLCKARCTTEQNTIEFHGEHTHPPDMYRIQNRTVVSSMLFAIKKHQPFAAQFSENSKTE